MLLRQWNGVNETPPGKPLQPADQQSDFVTANNLGLDYSDVREIAEAVNAAEYTSLSGAPCWDYGDLIGGVD
ncbi:MAG: hypothetical protein U0746_11785 [Gemmataceae bacterium]